MAKDLNQCNFIGRLGKQVEIKFTAGGAAVANFSIACSDNYKDKQGQKVEQTNWINIVVFGKLAEICGEYLKKGSQVFISGKQVTRKWQDQSGQDRYSTEIVADTMQMLGGRSDSASSKPAAPAQPDAPPADDGFDDIPFFDPYKFTWRAV